MRRQFLTALVALLLLGLMAPAVAAVEPGDEPGTALPVAAGTSTWDSTDMTAASPPDPAQCKDFPGPLFNTMWLHVHAGEVGDDRGRRQLVRVLGRADRLPGRGLRVPPERRIPDPASTAAPTRRRSSCPPRPAGPT